MATNTKKVTWASLGVGLFIGGAACNAPAEAGVPERQPLAPGVAVEQVPAPLNPKPPSLTFSALKDLKWKHGVEEGGALVCRGTSCQKGIVAYGPYAKNVPTGPRIATFRLGGKGLARFDREVATVVVYDAMGKKRLAGRAVKGAELPDEQTQNVEVPFTAPEESNLEFRISWLGDGELRMYGVEVR